MTNARGNTAVAERPTDTDTDAEDEGRINVTFSAPIPMRIEIEKAAKVAGIVPSDFVRGLVASAIGYALPSTTKVRKSSKTDEEKKAERLAASQEHRNKMKELLNRHRRAAGLPVDEKTDATAAPDA